MATVILHMADGGKKSWQVAPGDIQGIEQAWDALRPGEKLKFTTTDGTRLSIPYEQIIWAGFRGRGSTKQ